ncbi:MAG TPA: hypothetical protein VFP59_05130 [Candidatus Angelobacter sp.]|nr:hypothetical protein [Candidatus Angelobacter sp.]
MLRRVLSGFGRQLAEKGREGPLQGSIPAAQVAVTVNIGTQTFEGGLIAPDLSSIFPDLHSRCMVPSVEDKAVAVLLQLPLVAL